MNKNQASPINSLETTDCLEAVGVFKGWKNFLFVIVFLCILLLQASFLLVDTGYIKIDDQAGSSEPAVTSGVIDLDEENAEPVSENVQATIEPMQKLAIKINDPAETVVPEESVGPNQPAEAVTKTAEHKLQHAIAWPPVEFLSRMKFEYLTWVIRIANPVLILTALLYCLSMLFSLKVSIQGSFGGINNISRAFFLSLLMLFLLLPWQRFFGGTVTGAIFTPGELVEWSSTEAGDIFDIVIYYLRFSGYCLLVFFLLTLSQIYSIRWRKAILSQLEIM